MSLLAPSLLTREPSKDTSSYNPLAKDSERAHQISLFQWTTLQKGVSQPDLIVGAHTLHQLDETPGPISRRRAVPQTTKRSPVREPKLVLRQAAHSAQKKLRVVSVKRPAKEAIVQVSP